MKKPTKDQKQSPVKTELFRAEAVRHRTRALFGDVVLAAPLSTWLITGFLVVILAGFVAFGALANIQIDGESVPIWKWILG